MINIRHAPLKGVPIELGMSFYKEVSSYQVASFSLLKKCLHKVGCMHVPLCSYKTFTFLLLEKQFTWSGGSVRHMVFFFSWHCRVSPWFVQ